MTDPDRTQEFCRLFAYGSLKRGLANHAELAKAHFEGQASTLPSFALRIIDGYPALVPGTRVIRGELFRVPLTEMAALDEFEGEAYLRAEVELQGGARAVAYLARWPEEGQPFPAGEWPAP